MIKDLKSGTIVRALKDLDPDVANVRAGDLGVVFGASNCYGDDCGPIVRWFEVESSERTDYRHKVVMRSTCNVYEGQVEVLLKPEDDYLSRIDIRSLAQRFAHAFYREFEDNDWGDLDPEWFGLAFNPGAEISDFDATQVKALEAVLLSVLTKMKGFASTGSSTTEKSDG